MLQFSLTRFFFSFRRGPANINITSHYILSGGKVTCSFFWRWSLEQEHVKHNNIIKQLRFDPFFRSVYLMRQLTEPRHKHLWMRQRVEMVSTCVSESRLSIFPLRVPPMSRVHALSCMYYSPPHRSWIWKFLSSECTQAPNICLDSRSSA